MFGTNLGVEMYTKLANDFLSDLVVNNGMGCSSHLLRHGCVWTLELRS